MNLKKSFIFVLMSMLSTEIQFLKGVGPKRGDLLKKELDIHTFYDLLYYFPYKYIDRTQFYQIRDVRSSMSHIQIKGKIASIETIGSGRKSRLVATLADGTGTLELIWFKGIKWIEKNISKGVNYIVFGKPAEFNGRINIVHPEMEIENQQQKSAGTFQAFYNTTEKMKNNYLNSGGVLKLQFQLQSIVQKEIKETIPRWLCTKLKLMPLKEALKEIHIPENEQKLKQAIFRIKFEELFFIQLRLLRLKNARSDRFRGHPFLHVGHYVNGFYKNCIPFDLTGAQKKVIREIRKDLGSGVQMNRLLQGDVGSGKTLVALMSMLIGIDNGYQACLMAPTEILATQHHSTIKQMAEKLDLKIHLLTGSTKAKERRIIHEELENGTAHIIIGTHALLEDKVKFHNLGIVVIDEQHRFGVNQRSKLWQKNIIPPHVLVMTATPIPRTLAMTVYGDLDASIIDELPPGRKPIETRHFYENKRSMVDQFIRSEIAKGRQVYIVYPLIDESESLDYQNLMEGYQRAQEVFPEQEISMVHGKMKPAEKEAEMQRFKKGETQILVSTTVIEVGVDVPNASVMVIESSERFGLSQLHQLRGRVGRGAEQSFCILMSAYKLSKESQKRLETMVRTNDGFEIAEVDMALRGPGDIEGTQQSGLGFNLKLASLGKDGEILKYARSIALQIIEDDPLLKKEENTILLQQIQKMKQNTFNWSSIS